MPGPRRPTVTRRLVDTWLRNLEQELNSILTGSEAGWRARLANLEHRIHLWRKQLGVREGFRKRGTGRHR